MTEPKSNMLMRNDPLVSGWPVGMRSVCIGGPYHGMIVPGPHGGRFVVPMMPPEEWQQAFYPDRPMVPTLHTAMYRADQIDVFAGPLRLTGNVLVWEGCKNWKAAALGLLLAALVIAPDFEEPER